MSESIPPCRFRSNVTLADCCYYGIGGSARFFASPQSPAELARLLHWNREHCLPLALMGKGSNILFSDALFPGIVISLAGMNRVCWLSDEDLFCEAGAENTLIAEELLKTGKGGGEWLYRLPGQIGSTVRMNARCFGGEVSTITKGVLTASLDGRVRWQLPEEIFYGYKQTSLMDNPEIVLAVVLHFPLSRDQEEIRQLMQRVEDERTLKHHFDFPSCGSTFKNNYDAGRSSGQIFEELGFKGAVEGGAIVSDHHANFIYNRQGATAVDVLLLAARMRAAAREKAGVRLDLEVQCIGLFDHDLLHSCGVAHDLDTQDTSKGWSGLLWNPQKSGGQILPEPLFPRILLQGPPVGYYALDRELPQGCFVEVKQIISLHDAAANPDEPFLGWSTWSDNSALFNMKPPLTASTDIFTNELWMYGVSELFVAGVDCGGSSLEFEMTPEGKWVALRFEASRKRAKGYEVLSSEPWAGQLSQKVEAGRFGMELSFRLLEPFIGEGTIALQCCFSSGRGEYGLFPWWSESSTGLKPADFHQPAHYFPVTLL